MDTSDSANSIKTTYPFNFITKPIGPLCNLNCSYCFYLPKDALFRHENRKDYIMSAEILEQYTKQYIQSQPEGTREVVFTWQGGEPTLLNPDFYRAAMELQKKHNPDRIPVRNCLQTNGTLITDEMARLFKENDFLIGISIDGPEKFHNRYRTDRSGKGSFAMVMDGLEKLHKYSVEFNTLTVVQNDNASHPNEVYGFLKEAGSVFMQFIPIVEPVVKSGKPSVSNRTVPSLKWGEFLTGVFRNWLQNDIGKIFIQHFDLTLAQYMGEPASLCVHSRYCGRALAIEHDGNIYSCDHFVTPENHLGHISRPLPETVGIEKQRHFGRNKFDSLTQECLDCSYLTLCYGGCPKDRLVKRAAGMQNWLCAGYKHYYSRTYPVFLAMAAALRNGDPAARYRSYLRIPPEYTKGISGNSPCPCLSGKKFRNCHGA